MNNSTVVNNSNATDPPCSQVITTLFVVLLSIVSLAAFMGNLLVTVTCLKTPSLRTSTNYYIVNMAISDLLGSCFNWPLYATEGMLTTRMFIIDPLASIVCKLGLYLRGISQVVSVLSLVLIAVDRYVAIVFPLKTMKLNKGRVGVVLILVTWIIPVASGIPYFLYTDIVKEDNYTFCRISWGTVTGAIFNAAGFVAFYCAPLVLMTVLYSCIIRTLRKRKEIPSSMSDKRQKQHQKITKILISMVTAFFVCWTPLAVYLSLKLLHPKLFLKEQCHIMAALFFYLFPSLSTAINPVILFLFSTNYRQALKSLSLRLCSFLKRHTHSNKLASLQSQSSQVQEDNVETECKEMSKRRCFVVRRSSGRVSDNYSAGI